MGGGRLRKSVAVRWGRVALRLDSQVLAPYECRGFHSAPGIIVLYCICCPYSSLQH